MFIRSLMSWYLLLGMRKFNNFSVPSATERNSGFSGSKNAPIGDEIVEARVETAPKKKVIEKDVQTFKLRFVYHSTNLIVLIANFNLFVSCSGGLKSQIQRIKSTHQNSGFRENQRCQNRLGKQ